MTYYIYSTLATDMKYTEYHAPISGETVANIKHQVFISGRANVADKHLMTPRGVMTKVSDEDFAMLEKSYLFNLHRQNGYITFEKKAADVDKVVVNMKARDVSAPITPEFYKNLPDEINGLPVAKPDAKTKGKRRA